MYVAWRGNPTSFVAQRNGKTTAGLRYNSLLIADNRLIADRSLRKAYLARIAYGLFVIRRPEQDL